MWYSEGLGGAGRRIARRDGGWRGCGINFDGWSSAKVAWRSTCGSTGAEGGGDEARMSFVRWTTLQATYMAHGNHS
jgi:hypothetical protein